MVLALCVVVPACVELSLEARGFHVVHEVLWPWAQGGPIDFVLRILALENHAVGLHCHGGGPVGEDALDAYVGVQDVQKLQHVPVVIDNRSCSLRKSKFCSRMLRLCKFTTTNMVT